MWALVMSREFKLSNNLASFDCAECCDEADARQTLGFTSAQCAEGATAASFAGAHVIARLKCCKIKAVDVATQYASCVYSAVSLFLGLGLVPKTPGEQYLATVLAIFGACLQACVFGSVAVLIAGLDADESKHHQKLVYVAQRMRHLALPGWLRKRVVAYYEMMHDVEKGGGGDGEAAPK